MSPRGLIVFTHSSELGNAPANKLFDLVSIKRLDPTVAPRSFADYEVKIDTDALPKGVTVERLID